MSVTQTETVKTKPITNAFDLYKRFSEIICGYSEANQNNRQFIIGLNKAEVLLWNLVMTGTEQSPPQTSKIEQDWIVSLRACGLSIRELAAVFERSTETIHHILKENGTTGLQEETVEPAP